MLPFAPSPESVGVSSAGLVRFLEEASAAGLEFHGLVLVRHGKIACEMAWAPYATDTPHMLFSLSKSFTSAAVGFAVSEGYFGYDSRVIDLLPDKAPKEPSERLKAMTVHDLLCMGSGLSPASDSVDPACPDWAARTLSFPVEHAPGTRFHYNSQNTFLCSQIVQRKTGRCVRDYLMPRLFEPLDIAAPDWEKSPLGVTCGGWGLSLTTREIAKFGQLLLQDGIWERRRVLPEGWVRLATASKIDNSGRGASPDWEQGYGYQFWRCRNGHFRGDGMYGQLCWVMPEQDAVLAVTAGIPSMGMEADLVHGFLVPALHDFSADEAGARALCARIASLSYPFPSAGTAPKAPPQGTYQAKSGETLRIAFEGDVLVLPLTTPDGRRLEARYGLGEPLQSRYAEETPPFGEKNVLTGYGWSGGTLVTVLRMLGTPFTRISTLVFSGDTVTETITGAGFDRPPVVYTRCKEER